MEQFYRIQLIFLLMGLTTQTFSIRLVVAEGNWIWARNTVTGAYGEAVIGTNAALYIARSTKFYRYIPSNNSFSEMTSPPKPDGYAFKTGAALAWDFGNYIYALLGAATNENRSWFYRYSILENTWEALANTPVNQGEGDAITWVGAPYNCIYATVGGEQRSVYLLRYDPSTNSWDDSPADPPGGMGDGASLVWANGDCLYALRGEFLEDEPLCDFWRYNITSDSWSAMAEIPAYPHSGGVGGVGDGGSLLYIGFWQTNQADYIYALSGNQASPEEPSIPDNRTYRYQISTNSWERLADLPFGVGYYVGCRLGYADGRIYAWQGTPSTWAGGGDDLAYYVFQPEIRDLSVSVKLSNDKIYFGQNTTINVTITNEGTTNVYDPSVNIRLDEVINLTITFEGTIQPNRTSSKVFFIATTGIGLKEPIMPGNYTLHVEVYPIEGETDIEDNIRRLNFIVMWDYKEPSIGTPIQDPPSENVQPLQKVTVRISVIDQESGVKNVTLYYKVNVGEFVAKSMQLNQTIGLYETQIEGYDAGTKISYIITAYDNAGNKAQQDNAGEYFIYIVIPEFIPTIILLLFVSNALITTLLLKRKKLTFPLDFFVKAPP